MFVIYDAQEFRSYIPSRGILRSMSEPYEKLPS